MNIILLYFKIISLIFLDMFVDGNCVVKELFVYIFSFIVIFFVVNFYGFYVGFFYFKVFGYCKEEVFRNKFFGYSL